MGRVVSCGFAAAFLAAFVAGACGGEIEVLGGDGGVSPYATETGVTIADPPPTATGVATTTTIGTGTGTGTPIGTATVTATGTATSPPPTGLPLYERLGGYDGVRAFATNEFTKFVGDPTLATYFFSQAAVPIPAGHPSLAQIVECFGAFIGTAVQSLDGDDPRDTPTETYPATANDPNNPTTPDFVCRDMTEAHEGLRIGGSTFEYAAAILLADLRADLAIDGDTTRVGHVTVAEYESLAGEISGTRPAIVADPTAPDAPDGGACAYAATGSSCVRK